MTIVRDLQSPAAIHAFIVGICEYAWLIGGNQQPTFAQGTGMGPLTSAPASARAFASWFLKGSLASRGH